MTQTFDVLDRKLNVFRSYFLEASAGTGKTFAIEHLFVRVLIESFPQISIDQILAVTFTRAAAADMKRRIYRNLNLVLDQLKGIPCELQWDYVEKIKEQGREKIVETLQRIEEALISFDRAQIFTIHGFCYRMLSEFAFEADAAFFLNDPDGSDYPVFVRKSLEEFFRTELNKHIEHPEQLQSLLNKHRGNFTYFSERLIAGTQKERKTIDRHSLLQLQKELSCLYQNIEKERLNQDLELLFSQHKRLKKQAYKTQAKKLMYLTGNRSDQIGDLLQETDEWFIEKMQIEKASLHYPEFFQNLRSQIIPSIRKVTDPKPLLEHITTLFQQHADKRMQEKEIYSPDQLLKKMQEAIRKPNFKQCIQEKYRTVVVDEFQDTDPIQWNIFKELFVLQNRCHVHMVGDPKQSIYSFRKADIYTYLEAMNVIDRSAHVHLNVNYRSEPKLVETLNLLFSDKVSPRWMYLPLLQKTLNHHPVHVGLQETKILSEKDRGHVHFFLAQDALGRERQWPTKRLEEQQLFAFIAAEISDLRSQIPFKQICILVKDRFQSIRLKQFLAGRNIFCNIKRTLSLSDSLGFKVIEDFVEALKHYHQLSFLKKILMSSIVGWTDRELLAEEQKDQYQRIKAFFVELKETFEKKGFGVAFQQFLSLKFKTNAPSVYQSLVAREDLSLYRECMQTAELLIEEGRDTTLDELLQLLNALKFSSPEEDERLKIREEDDADKVAVMTTFASKGLEFEVVFALALASRTMEQEESEIEERDAEKMRQLYVALTRAKKRVYIPLIFETEAKPVLYGSASSMELFAARWVGIYDQSSSLYERLPLSKEIVAVLDQLRQRSSLSYAWIDPSKPLAKLLVKKASPLIAPQENSLIFPSLPIVSFSSLSQKNEMSEKLEWIESLEKSVHTLPLGSETGTLLHLILEKIFEEHLYRKESQSSIQKLIQKELQKTHLDGWEKIVEDLIKELLNMPLIDTFCLADLSFQDFCQEMEFLYLDKERLIKGFADLVFRYKDKYYLLDWKSNYLGNEDSLYSPEALEKAMQQHEYHFQAKLYAEALKRYLKRFDPRPFQQQFGGAFYLFLRGKAVYHFFPTE